MKVINNPEDIQRELISLKRKGKRIAFVPTMGYLHDGHLSLMRIARGKADILVVSIFVNPTQFGPGEDLDQYPRDAKRDELLCEKEEVDYLFYPTEESMYPDGFSTYVEETVLSKVLCGKSRPCHFKGVVTVVTKLFNIVQADVAVFGQKDAQQARIIEQLVKDLNFPIEIIVAPIVRDADGLAMSSRNTYLSHKDRNKALVINQSLKQAQVMIEGGERDAGKVSNYIRERLNYVEGIDIDYIEIRDYTTFEELEELEGIILIAIAVSVGDVRLIDNIIIWN